MESERLDGNKITKHMKATGVSYGALAAEIGVSTSMLRSLEDGYLPRRARDEILSRLAQVMGCSVGALVTPLRAKVG